MLTQVTKDLELEENIRQAVTMIANEIFYALIDKVPNTVFETDAEIEPFTNPIYSWVDSKGNRKFRVVMSMEKSTSEELTRAMFTLAETDEVTEEDINDAFGEIANVVGGNLKAVVEDSGTLTIPKVSTEKPWGQDPPIVALNFNWKGNFLIISISDLASMVEE
ncbi:MAG: chemotaxis protein CheX [Mobiluncus porci]|uniref:chemotaxis protein CheX n=1 Tax=Mobiluncus porci TaxID=2652278 RepID=UPI0023F0872C|nr:chemotaxis protein CheX [Mobiluncus porci]MDD7540964.1 chemotaxis protein CheX [Mobiluncus porci]MDY5748139.1 chemotaxis protein CheX [Mobiluncus porci]